MIKIFEKANATETRILLLTVVIALGIVIMSLGAHAVNIAPSGAIRLNSSDYTLIGSSGTIYQINDTGNGAIYVATGSNYNMFLDCNGTTILGNGSGDGFKSINNHNITVTNCNFQNYNRNVAFQGGENSTFYNNSFVNSIAGNNVYLNIVKYLRFENNSVINASGSFSTIYLSGSTDNSTNFVNISGNYIEGATTNGIHNNFLGGFGKDIQIIEKNNILNNSPFGADVSGSDGLIFQNNTFQNIAQYGIRVWYDTSICAPVNCSSKNTLITKNTFINNSLGDIWLYNFTNSTNITNNTYDNPSYANIVIKDGTGDLNATIDETNPSGFDIYYHATALTTQANITFNYTGRKYFYLLNNSILLTNNGVYRDILNITSNNYISADTTTYTIPSNSNLAIKDGGCDTVPVEDLNVNESKVLCGGTYYLNDNDAASNSGAIIINASNIVLQGNNTTIIGNLSISSVGIRPINFVNVTIQRLNITNYTIGIKSDTNTHNLTIKDNTFGNLTTYSVQLGTGNDFKILNNSFYNDNAVDTVYTATGINGIYANNYCTRSTLRNYYWCLYILKQNGAQKWLIENNTIVNSDGFKIFAANVTINNNSVTSRSTTSYGSIIVKDTNQSNTIIENNTFNNGMITIYIQNSTNISLKNNNLYNISAGALLNINTNAKDIYLYNNTFNLSNIAAQISNSSNIKFYQNNFDNSSLQYDNWFGLLYIKTTSNNITILNNTFEHYGSFGVLISSSGNISIQNNSFNQLSSTEKSAFNVHDYFDLPSAIQILQIQKVFNGDGSSNEDIQLDNISNMQTRFKSSNINITGNSFDNTVGTLIRNQNSTNMYTDIAYNSVWYVKWQPIYSLFDTEELYNNLNVQQLSCTGSISGSIVNCRKGYYDKLNNTEYYMLNYSFTQNKYNISYSNITVIGGQIENNPNNFNFKIYNLSSPYNDVLNVTTMTLLNANVTSYSINLSSGQQVVVGNYSPYLTSPVNNPTFGSGIIPITLVNLSSFANWSLKVYENVAAGGHVYSYSDFYPALTYSLDPNGVIPNGNYIASVTFCQTDGFCTMNNKSFTYTGTSYTGGGGGGGSSGSSGGGDSSMTTNITTNTSLNTTSNNICLVVNESLNYLPVGTWNVGHSPLSDTLGDFFKVQQSGCAKPYTYQIIGVQSWFILFIIALIVAFYLGKKLLN